MTQEYTEGHSSPARAEGHEAASTRFIEQAGVVCLRQRQDRPEVLLIQGRRNGKWGIPKGGIETGETSCQAATREAFEEAGVSGRCEEIAFASYQYRKVGKLFPCRVAVHIMEIETMSKSFPEMEERRPRWFDCIRAADLVGDDGLKRIIRSLAG